MAGSVHAPPADFESKHAVKTLDAYILQVSTTAGYGKGTGAPLSVPRTNITSGLPDNTHKRCQQALPTLA